MCSDIMDRNMVLQLESSWSSVRSYSMRERYIQKIPMVISCMSSMVMIFLNLTMMVFPDASFILEFSTSSEFSCVSVWFAILIGLGSLVFLTAAHCPRAIANGTHDRNHIPMVNVHNAVTVKYFFCVNWSLN